MSTERYTIDELCELTGLTRRTIRFYVERGLLAPPAGRGRGGFYAPEQLERLREIMEGRAEGLSLEAIERRWRGGEGQVVPKPTPILHRPPPDGRILRWALAPGITLDVDEACLAERKNEIGELLGLAERLFAERAAPSRLGIPQGENDAE